MGESAGPDRVAVGVDHLVVFVNGASPHSLALTDACVRLARRAPGFEVRAVVETSQRRPPRRATLVSRRLAANVARRLFQPGAGTTLPPGALDSARALARRAGVPLIEVPGRDVNNPGFRAELQQLPDPLVAVAVECLQIFGADLRDCFDLAVNYHNGRLPDYRGLGATSWSVYRGERESGFSFHRIDAGIDTGPLLVEGSVPIAEGATGSEVEVAKTNAAIAALPQVLEAMRRREPGRQQKGEGRYFGRRELRGMRRVDDPSSLTRHELQIRLQAFGVLEMPLGGGLHPVTALVEARDPRRCAFVSSDGVPLDVERILHLPPVLYRAVAPLARSWRR